MQGYVFVQSEEEYEQGVKPHGYCIRIGRAGLKCLCDCLKDHIEDYPNYHFRLKSESGKNLYLCLRFGKDK